MEKETATSDARTDAAEIVGMCEENGLSNRAAEWTNAAYHPAEVAGEIIDLKRTRGRRPAAKPSMGSTGSQAATGGATATRARSCAPRASSRRSGDRGEPRVGAPAAGGRRAPGRGHPHPARPSQPREQWQKRSLDSKTLSKGTELVFEEAGDVIDLLRARAAVVALGARMLTGSPASSRPEAEPGR